MSSTDIDQRLSDLENDVRILKDQLSNITQKFENSPSTMAGHISGSSGMSKNGFPYLRRGQRLDFASDMSARAHLLANWWPPESWGVWGKGDRHSLRFALDDSYHGGFVDIALHMKALLVPGAPRPLLDVVANGYHIGRAEVRPLTARQRFRLPPSCLDEGEVILYLSYSAPVVPASSFDSADMRSIGLGLVAIELE